MPRRRATRRNIAHQHAEWLSLIEVAGPFLSIPVLKEVFPEGLEKPDDEGEVKAQLRADYELWLEHQTDPEHQKDWIKLALDLALGFDEADEHVRQADTVDDCHTARIREHHETLKPDLVLLDTESTDAPKARLLVQIVPRSQNLEKPLREHRWKASPATRMAELVRNCADENVRLGLVTNGEDWMLVHAPRKGTSGYALWRADLLFEEDITLRAFRTLLSVDRFFGRPEDTLECLYDRSEKDQFEVTETLGLQVRDAVELLVDTIDTIDRHRDRTLLADYPERRLYEAVVSLMMRLVFILFAEENDLLPAEDRVYQQNYALSPLLDQLQADHDKHGPQSLQHRTAAWHRLLATFRAIHGGVEHEDLHLPAYGGDLFDPDHFPFFEGRARGGDWRKEQADPLPVDDLTVMRLLESLLLLEVGGAGSQGITTRRLSYSSLGIEQIGNVYESLLDHTVVRADDIVLGLYGRRGAEPEVPLERIEEAAARGDDQLIKLLKEETQKQPAQIKQLLEEGLPGDDPRWRQVVGGDDEVLDRIKPYAGLVRDDHVDMPMVREPSAVYVTQTSSRRDTGTQYTPPSFTGPIVRYALEPLVYDGPSEGKPEEEWKLRTPREILALKICDLAMGSAAFLVQTCRYLGDRLVEGWEEIEQANPGKILVSPEGDLSTGDPSESIIPRDTSERIASARRYIAERCVYGIDKDPMAVEMAKLSMWLVTMQKGKPFSFLDHALKCGDALLGITRREQLERFDLEPENSRQISIFEETLSNALGKALDKRIELEGIAVNDIRDAEEKARLLKEAEESLEIVRLAGDLLIGASLASYLSDYPSYRQLRDQLSAQFAEALGLPAGDEKAQKIAALVSKSRELLDAGATSASDHRRPFDWLLEFPEIFQASKQRGDDVVGLDAFVGNPPFQGGQKITGVLGTNYREFLIDYVADSQRGSADLCAYMFLRVHELLAQDGRAGLIATNTIAQGQTCQVSLMSLVNSGTHITRAVATQKWPGNANVDVSIVWTSNGDWNGICHLDNNEIHEISPTLSPRAGRIQQPQELQENDNLSFQGSIVLGLGFILDIEEARNMIASDPKCREVIQPYLTGRDLNGRIDQSPSRYVINFFDWTKEKAQTCAPCWDIVEQKVRPDRQRQKPNGRFVLRDPLPERYWHYAEKRPKLYSLLSKVDCAVVCSLVSKNLIFDLHSTGTVFAHKLCVFPSNDIGFFGALQSEFHVLWAWEYSSTMRTAGINYSPSKCFLTWPMPADVKHVRPAAERLRALRQNACQDRNHGLGKLYNAINSPAIADSIIEELRIAQIELDLAVRNSYGWSDLELDHDFHSAHQGTRFTVSPAKQAQILDRLLTLNQERFAAEQYEHNGSTSNRQSGDGDSDLRPQGADHGQLSLLDPTDN